MLANRKRPRILITGGSGLLALNWACTMRESWEVILGVHSHKVKLFGTSTMILDLDNKDRLDEQVYACSPDLIVHAAGLTNVDICENSPNLARISNVDIAGNVAQIAKNRNIYLIHISTDHLSDGKKQFTLEDDEPLPINEYARTKLAAEKLVLSLNSNALVLRTNFFCWGHGLRQSNSDWLIHNIRAGKEISLFEDIFFTPILADLLAIFSHKMVKMNAKGIYNLVGEERISKYDFAIKLCRTFGLSENYIKKTHSSSIKLIAPRPSDMSLSAQKAKDHLGIGTGGVDHFLSILKDQEKQGRSRELYNAVSK
jgi:dTDP-4-dehydrorhamnose reductase